MRFQRSFADLGVCCEGLSGVRTQAQQITDDDRTRGRKKSDNPARLPNHTCFTNAIKVCFAVTNSGVLFGGGWLLAGGGGGGEWLLVGTGLLAGVWLMRG